MPIITLIVTSISADRQWEAQKRENIQVELVPSAEHHVRPDMFFNVEPRLQLKASAASSIHCQCKVVSNKRRLRDRRVQANKILYVHMPDQENP